MQRILVLEDDHYLRRDILSLLTAEGFAPVGAGTLQEAQALLAGQDADLFLLDLWLPDGDGFTFLERVRELSSAPVLFLTVCDDEASVVRGFSLGADDYITKPFRKAELISRIRANLRRVRAQEQGGVLQAGALRVDVRAHRVSLAGEDLNLRPAEFRLLLVLMQNDGLLLSRERLLSLLDADVLGDGAEDNTLSVHISRLRGKIGSRYIETVRGFGYRFREEVVRLGGLT